jgi:hypothetical protein
MAARHHNMPARGRPAGLPAGKDSPVRRENKRQPRPRCGLTGRRGLPSGCRTCSATGVLQRVNTDHPAAALIGGDRVIRPQDHHL